MTIEFTISKQEMAKIHTTIRMGEEKTTRYLLVARIFFIFCAALFLVPFFKKLFSVGIAGLDLAKWVLFIGGVVSVVLLFVFPNKFPSMVEKHFIKGMNKSWPKETQTVRWVLEPEKIKIVGDEFTNEITYDQVSNVTHWPTFLMISLSRPYNKVMIPKSAFASQEEELLFVETLTTTSPVPTSESIEESE